MLEISHNDELVFGVGIEIISSEPSVSASRLRLGRLGVQKLAALLEISRGKIDQVHLIPAKDSHFQCPVIVEITDYWAASALITFKVAEINVPDFLPGVSYPLVQIAAVDDTSEFRVADDTLKACN